ncbi:MAG: hypothetical protein AAF702_18510 [Chloroflexota bacterium]
MSTRLRDFALIVGHTWRCYECRDLLIESPERTCRGYKLTEQERESAEALTDDHFRTVMDLADATGLSVQDLEKAIDHPHARLRHLGSYRSREYFINR